MRRGCRPCVLAVRRAARARAVAGVAAAGNGGFAPPAPASPNAAHIRDVYCLILGFTGAIFLLVEAPLVIFIVSYRSRGRARDGRGRAGARAHAARADLDGVPGRDPRRRSPRFVFYELPGIDDAPAAGGPTPTITVEGHQYYWQFRLPERRRSRSTTCTCRSTRSSTSRSSRRDVIHSWWIPALGGKIQAIPGRTNHHLVPGRQLGTYSGQCAELCGVHHAAMLRRSRCCRPASTTPGSPVAHGGRSARQARSSTASAPRATASPARAAIGPPIANNPLLDDRNALDDRAPERRAARCRRRQRLDASSR